MRLHGLQIAKGATQLLSRRSVPKEPSKIARHFNAGKGLEKIESRRDGRKNSGLNKG
jgi:hypothetical protein